MPTQMLGPFGVTYALHTITRGQRQPGEEGPCPPGRTVTGQLAGLPRPVLQAREACMGRAIPVRHAQGSRPGQAFP